MRAPRENTAARETQGGTKYEIREARESRRVYRRPLVEEGARRRPTAVQTAFRCRARRVECSTTYLGIVGYAGPTAHKLRHPVGTRARLLACTRLTKHPGGRSVERHVSSPQRRYLTRRDRIYKYDYKGRPVSAQNVLTFPSSHFTIRTRRPRSTAMHARERDVPTRVNPSPDQFRDNDKRHR